MLRTGLAGLEDVRDGVLIAPNRTSASAVLLKLRHQLTTMQFLPVKSIVAVGRREVDLLALDIISSEVGERIACVMCWCLPFFYHGAAMHQASCCSCEQ